MNMERKRERIKMTTTERERDRQTNSYKDIQSEKTDRQTGRKRQTDIQAEKGLNSSVPYN